MYTVHVVSSGMNSPAARLRGLCSSRAVCRMNPIHAHTPVQAADYVTAELSKTNKAKRLKGFEAVRGVLLEPTPFSVSPVLMCSCANQDLDEVACAAAYSTALGSQPLQALPCCGGAVNKSTDINSMWHDCSGGG